MLSGTCRYLSTEPGTRQTGSYGLHYLLYTVVHITWNIRMCKKQMNKLERHKVDSNDVTFIIAAALLAAAVTVTGHALITCCVIRLSAVSRTLISGRKT